MVVFTSICANYLHKARILAKSVKDNITNVKFIVCLTENEKRTAFEYEYFDDIILSKDMWEGNFERFIFKHSIVEASTAVKGQFFRYLYKTYPEEEMFVYLDPDCYVYSDFIEIKDLLKSRPIILCPHLLQPGNIDMELSSTAHGVYNLGFLAVNRSEEAQRLINWWADRLKLFCYDDIQRGIFTDQKWFDLAPCFFDVEILKHHGYDFAPWSLLNCGMTKESGEYKIMGDSIRFIHFSGYGKTAQKCMSDWLPKGEHPFKELYEEYSKLHEENNKDNISSTPWSYSNYKSGEKILDSIRIKYRENYELMHTIEDPFIYSNQFFKNSEKNNKISYYYQKSKEVIDEEGFSALLKKIVKRVIQN